MVPALQSVQAAPLAAPVSGVVVGALYLLVAAIAVTFLSFAIYSTVGRKEGRLPPASPRAGPIGLILLILVLLALVVPLAQPAGAPTRAQHLSVDAQQFSWTLSSDRVIADITLIVNVTQTEVDFFNEYGRVTQFRLNTTTLSAILEARHIPEIKQLEFVSSIRERPTIFTDAPVEFVATSRDVGHRLGVYAPDGSLLLTINAVPGVTTTETFRFESPGQYTLRCLRHCGVGHHLMTLILTVSPGGTTACAGC